jgi:8-oxo-dGTP pyrophosphatase MutT (NUDIX family)
VTISSYLAGLRAKVGSELLLLPAVAVVLRDPGGRVLLVRDRDSGTWSLPAGSIEPSEPPLVAARRELLEETGIDCHDLSLEAALGGESYRHTYPNGDAVEYAIFVYAGTVESADVVMPRDSVEIAEARFFSRSDAPVLALPYPGDLVWSFD